MPILTVPLNYRPYWENCFPPEELIKNPKPTKQKIPPQTKKLFNNRFQNLESFMHCVFLFQPFFLTYSMLQIFTRNGHNSFSWGRKQKPIQWPETFRSRLSLKHRYSMYTSTLAVSPQWAVWQRRGNTQIMKTHPLKSDGSAVDCNSILASLGTNESHKITLWDKNRPFLKKILKPIQKSWSATLL